MNLKLATLEYVALKQSMGMRFETEAALLRSFVKQMGDAVAVATVTSKDVLRYLNGRNAGPVTLFWHRKHDVLKGYARSTVDTALEIYHQITKGNSSPTSS